MSRLLFSRFAHYLDAVARLGSIRKASEQLNVSASAIDKQLIRAEEELGVALFERLPRGMRLTSAGEMLIHGVRGWQKDFGRIRFEIEELKGLRRGEVKIVLSQEAATGFLPAALAPFLAEHPRIRHQISVVEPDRVRQQVIDGAADFGLTFSPQPMPGVSVTCSTVFSLRALLPALPEAAPPEGIALETFFSHPTLVPDASTHVRDAVDIAAARIGRRLQPVATMNSLDLMRALVREGCGYGLAVLPPAAPRIGADGLWQLPFTDRGLPPLTLSLIVDPHRSPSMTSILVRKTLEAAFARLETDVAAAGP
ncbi:transcriptional regulator [Xaviernesmea oryzae]|uniref:Transcriptional regulator n=1 Tax=Xaviernesmea oryzae TaxID=464029 RepID=A0A1Q9B3D1_9HYPH|nr:LysR family transcriptional regulator [Xaviernesmea oryzae]OLP62560.1 transcriptional regulator [Xaviernesmea oryzae]SEM19518.1 DNA-binding transcriptional regulator, LysR family [Xaviernesmea oryzae]